MSTEVYERAPDLSEPERHGIVDVDVHPGPADPSEIRERMQMPWRDRYRGDRRTFYRHPVHGSREDSKTAGVGPECSDPGLLRRQLIDAYGVAHAILVMRTFCNLQPDPDLGKCDCPRRLQRLAFGDMAGPLQRGRRFKGSITVTHQDPRQRRARSSAGRATPTLSR